MSTNYAPAADGFRSDFLLLTPARISSSKIYTYRNLQLFRPIILYLLSMFA
ncbi:hypothetical protein LEP1GSC120_2970 [Leptospira santarosai str. 200702252]|nr:hypothetical protein LEP1GSC130_3877 [Leptospira santarosai str. 200403458]EMO99231.1 hypothetical protein LEP1GSC120_2970 [Leptospira santarosai str. 200702252]